MLVLQENRLNKPPSQVMRQREEGMTNHLRIFSPSPPSAVTSGIGKAWIVVPLQLTFWLLAFYPERSAPAGKDMKGEEGWLEQVCSDKWMKTVQSMTALWEGSRILLLCSLNNGILSGGIRANKERSRERAGSCIEVPQIFWGGTEKCSTFCLGGSIERKAQRDKGGHKGTFSVLVSAMR